MYEIRTI